MKMNKAFTLIELLMVISIIAILSSLALLTLRSVREDAQVARTRSVLNQVRDLLQEKLDTIGSRQMPFGFQKDFGIGIPLLPANAPYPVLNNNLIPDYGQQRFIFKRVMCEWIRTEMPAYQEYLFSYPSVESQQVFDPAPPPPTGFARWDQVSAYWPQNVGLRNWVGIFVRMLGTRPSPEYQLIRSQITSGITDNLTDGNPLDNEFWIKENNNGYLPLPVPGVSNVLTGDQLARSITESSELLYVTLYNTFDRDGNRGTHFLRPEDLGDVDGDGYPEIVDNRGMPIVFSITVQNIGQDGLPIDRNGDGMGHLQSPVWPYADFRDAMPDSRFPGEPQDYLIHLGSIGLQELPDHLQHLKNADFSNPTNFPNF